ncbi:peptide-methionine (R)-S-oxide reductase [Flavobacteriaceae bacterium UJ101]|nr:peptide-methionine (R)-S-oxide reductase [Flavobacteriaceae bacterium UJ101]
MRIIIVILVSFSLQSCAQTAKQKESVVEKEYNIQKTEQEWKKELSPEEYYVLRGKGTERPGTGKYNLHFEEGTYHCNACGAPLFKSETKFDAHCGWPSFDQEIEGSVTYKEDLSHGMVRTEILCTNCGSHLGHVFDDGPTQTGKRFCVNSVSLEFEDKDSSKK